MISKHISDREGVASTGPTNGSDRVYVTVVVENDLSDLGY